MKSFFQRHSESRPGPSKPPSKSRHKLWTSVDSAQVTPPIATAPPEKQRNSEDRPYAPSRPTAQNGIAPGVPASAVHGQMPHARSQSTQPQDVPARATQPVNGSPDDRDARGRRSAKPPTPLSSSEHVSGIDEPKTARPSRQRGGQEPGPPATAPAPEIWIPPSTTTQPTNHAPSRPSQDRERMQPHREEGRRDREHGERERERDRVREREKERKREKENKRDEDYRARDAIAAEKDYTRSRDPERHRERERRREYPSSGTKDRDRDRDRTRDRAGESGRGKEGDRTRERYEYERAERERIRAEEERYARTREQAERDKIKEASRATEPHQSRSHSKSRHRTREFLEEGEVKIFPHLAAKEVLYSFINTLARPHLYEKPRTTESSSHKPPEMLGDRTRKGSNASQTARYSPQTVNKADGSPGTHGDVLKPEHTSSRPNYPPQGAAKAPSRTPSMVKLSEYAGGTIPVGRVPSHTSDPSRSHPPSPANNPASSGPLPIFHTESSKPEAAKGTHSPYQVWHPPTPITQHSTPQGGLQPLNGASEGQKPPSATRLAPSSSPAIVPNVATEAPVNNGQYGQFLHPSSAAMRPRTISTDSTRNKPKDIPPPTTSRSPKDSPIQSKGSPTSGTNPSPAEAGNSGDSPQQPLPILLRVQIKPDSSPETIVPSSSVNKKGSSTESVHISATVPYTSTSKDSRNTHAAPPSSHIVPNAYPSNRPNGTRTVTFAQPHETTSSQRPKDTPTYPMSTQHGSGREAQTSEFGERQATVQDNTIVNRTYAQPPTAESKPAPSSHSQQAVSTTARHRSSMHPVAASQHPPTAPSFTLPPAEPGYDSTYRRHRHEHRPPPTTQSRYTSATTPRNLAPPLAPPPTAPPTATDHRSLLSDPTVPYGAPRPTDRSTSREDLPHPTTEALPMDNRLVQPADPRQGHSTPIARIQNQRLAELLSSPVPTSTDKIISVPHGYVQPASAPETRQGATRAADMPPPRVPYPQESSREDHISQTAAARSDHLRRRTSAQRLPSTNPPLALPVVGGGAPQQPIPGDSAHSSSHRNALAYPSKFQSQWSNSSAMATDGSQNTITKSRASPTQKDPSNSQGNADARAAPSQKAIPPVSSTTAYPQVSSASRYASTKARDAYVEDTGGSQQPRYADGFNGTQKGNIVAASHAGEIINPALQQYTTNTSAAPSGSVPTQPSRSHRAVEQPGYPTAYTNNNGASHHRSRSSVIYNNVPPTLVRPQHHHSASMPAPVHPDDHAVTPPMARAYNSHPHPTTQPTSASQVPSSQSTQHGTIQQTGLPSGANPSTHMPTNGTARPLARKPSEESVLQTPSSLAQSVPVSRSNSQASQQERTRKTSLLGMFRRGPKASQQANEPANATVPSEVLPPTDRERSRVPPSQPVQPPPPKPSAYDRPHHAIPPTAVPKVRITPQPGHSNKPHGHAPPPKLFNPFSYLTSKRYRTVSAASLEAVDGTATNTAVASPTVSMHSQAPPPPPQRDVYVATQMWAQADYRGRPGVVFDVAEESRIEGQKKPLTRRGTGRRPSREERAPEYSTQTAQAES
ncbi:hypothetical protein EYR40_000745 [Pleurotus pulmonarius]|nr:hypothetical protein EYR40_000745 [Pleurotus pulmonarius]